VKWIAINLRDFHDPSKKWQRGTEDHVQIRIVNGKNLDQAKRWAQFENNDPWLVHRLDTTRNIIYAKEGHDS